nr:MAG TPA: hypothetical protein [Caudoviricetes sp.]
MANYKRGGLTVQTASALKVSANKTRLSIQVRHADLR